MVKIFSFYTGQVFGGLPYIRSLTPRVSPSHAPVLSFAHCTTSKRLLRRLIFPSPGNFHHNHSSIIVLQYWRTQNVCNISKTNFFLINQKMKFLAHAASCLLLVMHWNNIETGLELKQMDCLIERGFQVFLLQLLSSSFRYIRDHLIPFICRPAYREIYRYYPYRPYRTFYIVWKMQSMRMIAKIS